jgi:SAM-dependent methyltransferase
MVDVRHQTPSDDAPVAETQQTYDLIAGEFARITASPAAEVSQRLSHLAASLPAGALVADIGCGPGRDTAFLRKRGFRVVGLDLSIGQLRAHKQPGFVQADMRRLPLRAESVDAIWCHAALQHLPRAFVPGVLAEFGRVVRQGGALALSVTEGDGEGFEVASKYGSDRRRWFTFYRAPELSSLLAAAGFTVDQTFRHRTYGDWLSIDATRY